MADENLPLGATENKLPIVFEREGRLFANSRDVAAYFGKQHGHVMRDIRDLIAKKPELGISNFGEAPYVEPSNGQTYKTFDMDRKGFTILTMGFTGIEALDWKIAYIDRFDAMEAALKLAPAIPDLSDPVVLVQLLTEHASKRIEAERAALAAQQEAAEAKKVAEAATETVHAFDRIAKADGSLCLTDAAKDLQVRPKDLFTFARRNGWIYSRPGKAGDIAYQDKIQAGYLEHKVTTVTRSDGTEKTVEQVRVTSKGLAKLAMVVPGAKRINGTTRQRVRIDHEQTRSPQDRRPDRGY